MSEGQQPSLQHTVRCKAMHANIEAMEYITNNLLVQIKAAHEKILYNHNEEAMTFLAKTKSTLEAMSALYEATEKLNTNVLQF